MIFENISIDSMKSESQSNIGYHHLRQGGYGNWRNIFTVKQNEIFDTVGVSLLIIFNSLIYQVYLEKMRSFPLMKFNFGHHSMTGDDLIM
jgi:hypothetical protein